MPAQSVKKHEINVKFDSVEFHVYRDMQEVFTCTAATLKSLGAPLYLGAEYGFADNILNPAFQRAANKTDNVKKMIELALEDVAGPGSRKHHKTEFDTLMATV